MTQNKYRTFAREKQTELELQEELEKLNPNKEEGEDKENDIPADTPQEQSWKKRYGDLRSHTTKTETELRSELAQIKAQLAESTKKQIRFPKTEEEIQEWTNKYPDVAKIIETIVMKKVSDDRKEVDERLNTLAQRERALAAQRAFEELLKLHPDFKEIRESDDFVTWIDDQPQYIRAALYENDTDVKSAARAIDLFKADMASKGKGRSTNAKDATRDAARSVKTPPTATPEDEGKIKFTESMLAKMNNRDVEKYWPEIQKDMENPAFYDLSGGAR